MRYLVFLLGLTACGFYESPSLVPCDKRFYVNESNGLIYNEIINEPIFPAEINIGFYQASGLTLDGSNVMARGTKWGIIDYYIANYTTSDGNPAVFEFTRQVYITLLLKTIRLCTERSK